MLDGAYSVSELNHEIAEVLRLTYPNEVWVHGEIASLSRRPNGHVYFQLVDSGDPDVGSATHPDPGAGGTGELFPQATSRARTRAAVIPVVLFDSARQAVNQALTRAGGAVRMSDGTRIRIRARVELYAPQGRVQLRMTAIDPAFTLALLQSERERVLAVLASAGLLDRNAQVPLPRVVERVGLVTSDGSAAMADFVHELETSGLRWHVVFAHAQVQGVDADRSIAAALTALDRRGVDAIALVRGGGAKTDLATFDSELLGRTIAGLGTSVITGVGHEIDTSVADVVAHTSLKTPTACAAHLVRHAMTTVDHVDDLWRAIGDLTSSHLAALEHRARSTASQLETTVRSRLTVEQHGLSDRGARLRREALRAVALGDRRLDAIGGRLGVSVPRALRAAEAADDLRRSRLATLDPNRLLMRGWSITTRGDGRIVRSIEDLQVGDSITTTLADGTVSSTVSTVPARPGSATGEHGGDA